MSEWCFVNASYRSALDRAGLGGFDAWMTVARRDERDSDRGESLGVVEAAGLRVFLKRLGARPKGFRFFLRRSRLRREAENAMFLRTAGVPAAEVVAAGERRRRGFPVEAFIATKEIAGARTLAEFAAEFPPGLRGRRRREKVVLIEKLALVVRRMHDAGYEARDLHARNVLVAEGPDGSHAFWLIDHPRGRRLRLGRRRGCARDLACLGADLSGAVSRTDLARFVKFYRGIERLDRRSRAMVRDVAGRLHP